MRAIFLILVFSGCSHQTTYQENLSRGLTWRAANLPLRCSAHRNVPARQLGEVALQSDYVNAVTGIHLFDCQQFRKYGNVFIDSPFGHPRKLGETELLTLKGRYIFMARVAFNLDAGGNALVNAVRHELLHVLGIMHTDKKHKLMSKKVGHNLLEMSQQDILEVRSRYENQD